MATTQTPAPADDSNEDSPKENNRRRIMLPIAIIVALALGYWAFGQWRYSQTHVSTDDAAVDGHMVPVLAKVGGYVQSVTVAENNRVAADSLVVLIDPSEYNVRLAAAPPGL